MSNPLSGAVVIIISHAEQLRDVTLPEGIERTFDGAFHVRPGATMTVSFDEYKELFSGADPVKFRVLVDPKGLTKPKKAVVDKTSEVTPDPPKESAAKPESSPKEPKGGKKDEGKDKSPPASPAVG